MNLNLWRANFRWLPSACLGIAWRACSGPLGSKFVAADHAPGPNGTLRSPRIYQKKSADDNRGKEIKTTGGLGGWNEITPEDALLPQPCRLRR